MIRKALQSIGIVLAMSLVVSCRSTKSVERGRDARTVAELIGKNEAARGDLQAVSAKLNVALQAEGKDLSVGGMLRMKRDEVIQISLSAFFVEVARLEITPDYVLVIDRMGKQYVRTSYQEQAFLKRSGLDFSTLQALFWSRLFVPGRGEQIRETDFVRSSGRAADEFVLRLDHPGQVALSFVLGANDGLIRRVEASDAAARLPLRLNWEYEDYRQVGRTLFPGQMVLETVGTEKPLKVTLALSSVKQDDSWQTHTQVSAKYKQVSVDALIKRLLKRS